MYLSKELEVADALVKCWTYKDIDFDSLYVVFYSSLDSYRKRLGGITLSNKGCVYNDYGRKKYTPLIDYWSDWRRKWEEKENVFDRQIGG